MHQRCPRLARGFSAAPDTSGLPELPPPEGVLRLYHCVGARSLRALWAFKELGLQDGSDYELITMPFPPRASVGIGGVL